MTVEEWEPIDFEAAEVKSGESGAKTLIVRGNAPGGSAADMEVKLVPVAYIAMPEYWSIDVWWNRKNAIFTAPVPYETSIRIDGICGSKGVEVFGKTRSVKIDL